MLDRVVIRSDNLCVEGHSEARVGFTIWLGWFGHRQRVDEVEVVLVEDRVEDCRVLYIDAESRFIERRCRVVLRDRSLLLCRLVLGSNFYIRYYDAIVGELASIAVVCMCNA